MAEWDSGGNFGAFWWADLVRSAFLEINMEEGRHAHLTVAIQFDPKELICPNCCDIPIESCPKHGKDNIEFKCKFHFEF